MKKSHFILLTSALALSTSHTALAGNRAGAFTITPEIGYYHFATKRHLSSTAAIPAIAVGYDFCPTWGIEFAYANINTHYRSSANYTGHVRGDLYTVDGVYHFNSMGPGQMLQPYLDLGVGVVSLNPNGTSATNQANVNGAFGAQMFFDNSIALRAEARDIYTMAGGKNDWMLDFGVSFLIGGNTPTPVVYKDSFKD